MIESEFCFEFFFSFFVLVLCLLNLVFMFGSSSRGDKFAYAMNFCVSFYDVIHKRALFVCTFCVNFLC